MPPNKRSNTKLELNAANNLLIAYFLYILGTVNSLFISSKCIVLLQKIHLMRQFIVSFTIYT